MQKALCPPLGPPSISFSDFLPALFQMLEREGVRPCVLRNYEGFPNNNIGHDIDFLICPSEQMLAVRAIFSIQDISIVGYAERSCVGSMFLSGVSPDPKAHALQVDFDMSLSWKGIPFLPTEAVLAASIPRRAGNLNFFVPSPVHEAIISLLSSLLVGGWLKEKYFPQVQRSFSENREKTVAVLRSQFGLKTASRLVDSVTDGNRQKVLGCVPFLRASLLLRSFWHRPIRSTFAIVRHYTSEFSLRFSPKTLETVCVLHVDGGSQTAMIEALIPLLQSTAKVVEKRQTQLPRSYMPDTLQAERRAKFPAGTLGQPFFLMANVVLWLVKEWLSQFKEKKNLTLRICDSCYYGLLIDPCRGRQYGLPQWFMRLAGKLLTPPNLWILLDRSVLEMQTGTLQLPPAETLQSREAYRAFVKARGRHVILNASQPAAFIAEEAYTAIIEMLAQRTEHQLRSRFQSLQGFQRKAES